ncbi:uncharacterized protein DNG_00676 [Cephalotrichum gorgonifer]|uniref:Uncharacterized protein n=1 Tax=Cephalotrichum gorgonifer TaxID=2041049 RepID=A0AAE8MPA0_9PEZI|nr:uncharacterized protein DNG_00676 [Cephalotrichum gorgonifer]
MAAGCAREPGINLNTKRLSRYFSSFQSTIPPPTIAMAKFSTLVIATAALLAGVQAAVAPRAEICAEGTVACGYDLQGRYGLSIEDDVRPHTPDGLSPFDSLFICGPYEDGVLTIAAYVDTCATGHCVGDHRRPDHDDAFCEVV